MSHMVKVSGLKVTDLNALRVAARKLGAKVEESRATARYFAGKTYPCLLAVTLPDCQYDVAVNRAEDGTYFLSYDSFGLHGQRLSKFVSQLKQEYAVESVRARAKRLGWTVTEKRVGDVVKIHLTTSED